MYSVYALTDPRNDAIRYVGMSKNVWRRYATHLLIPAKAAPTKTAWIEELREVDLSPLLKILETMETEKEALERETYWIWHFLEGGAFLLNSIKMNKNQQLQKDLPSYTVEEVATELRYSPDTVKRMLRRGDMPGYKLGNEWRIDKAEYEAWKRQNRNQYQKPAEN